MFAYKSHLHAARNTCLFAFNRSCHLLVEKQINVDRRINGFLIGSWPDCQELRPVFINKPLRGQGQDSEATPGHLENQSDADAAHSNWSVCSVKTRQEFNLSTHARDFSAVNAKK